MEKIENKWYYFKNTGAMAVGWIYIDGSWYYTNSNGEMQTGWLKIDEKTYYLSGRLNGNRVGSHKQLLVLLQFFR